MPPDQRNLTWRLQWLARIIPSRMWRVPAPRGAFMRAERFAIRDRTYGIWHRAMSIVRYLAPQQAEDLTMVDLDSVLFTEHHASDSAPLCLIEVARDIGQTKHAGVVRRLAAMADIPAFIALYTPSAEANPSDPRWPDIERFRVQRLWPQPETGWRELSPAEWARALVRIRGWQMRRFEAREAANDETF